MHLMEWLGPHKLPVWPLTGWDGEGLVGMGDGRGVPGGTGGGACKEAGSVIEKMGDDDFKDIRRETCGRRRASRYHKVFAWAPPECILRILVGFGAQLVQRVTPSLWLIGHNRSIDYQVMWI